MVQQRVEVCFRRDIVHSLERDEKELAEARKVTLIMIRVWLIALFAKLMGMVACDAISSRQALRSKLHFSLEVLTSSTSGDIHIMVSTMPQKSH